MGGSTESIIVGLVYVVSGVFFVITYGLALVAIATNKDLVKMACYKILLAIGVLDFSK